MRMLEELISLDYKCSKNLTIEFWVRTIIAIASEGQHYLDNLFNKSGLVNEAI